MIDGAGNVVGISKVARDISERKHAEQQRARLAAIVDSSDDAIIGLTVDNVITSWNRGADRLFGYTAEEVVGQSFSLLVLPGSDEVERATLESVTKGEVVHFDAVRRRKDGRNVDVSVVLSPVRDAEGRVVGLSRVTRDITDRKRAEDALARAKDAAEAATRELEAFSYSVAHDLRAPLRGMNGFAQVLLDTYKDRLDAEGQDWLQEILLNAKKMGDLIDGLLSLARVTRSELKSERVDLSALVREAAGQLATSAPPRTVAVVIQDGLHANVDPRLARVVLANLLGNAWKFTCNVTAARIEFGEIEEPRRPRVLHPRQRRRVRDGVREQAVRAVPATPHRRRISWDRHRSRDRATHRAPPWRTDLGRSGGKRRCDVLFHVRAGSSLMIKVTDTLRVLLVEDSPTDAKLVVQELQRTGCVVEFERVETAEAMRAALEAKTWDVVISDWSMPKFSRPGGARDPERDGTSICRSSSCRGRSARTPPSRRCAPGRTTTCSRTSSVGWRPPSSASSANARSAWRGAQAEDALRESEARFRRLAESGVIGIVIADMHGDILDANDTYLRMLGYSREELLSGPMRWADLTPPELAHVGVRAVEQLQTTGVARPWETEYVSQGRQPRAGPRRRRDARLPRGHRVHRDLTERKRVEEDRKQEQAGRVQRPRRRCGRARSSSARRRRWRRSGGSPAASRTTSTTCSPSSSATAR